ncbi:uroporphyrinogen-III C-methyltransferase [bacterium]|nr:uroporphyrinogen-III C-methyltransferase [bacterium]
MILTAPNTLLIAAFRRLEARLRPPRSVVSRSKARDNAGHVVLLGAGPGSADLITLRGLAALQAADVIYHDRLADPALLSHARPGALCIPVGKAPGHHSVPQDQINARLIASARLGHAVVRLKCGDPGIFGRGAEEAEALTRAGVGWSIIPGVTAACAAAAAAQSFLTERGQTERVVFATGHRRAGEVTDWRAAAAPGTTLACYMGVSTAAGLQAGLLEAGWPAACLVEVVSKAQTPDQRILRGRLVGLAQLCQSEPRLNPAILLIRWPATLDQSKATPIRAAAEVA